MSDPKYWTEYKKHVERTFKDFGEDTPVILTYGLASEICEVFDVSQREIIDKKRYTRERLSEMGDVLWFIAAIEIYYDLPYPRYASYFGVPFQLHTNHGINLVKVQSEALSYASDVSAAMVEGDADTIQYSLNKIVSIIFDMCMLYGVNNIDCLNANVAKLKERHPDGFEAGAIKEYENEYNAISNSIQEKGGEEILLNLVMDKEADNPYIQINVEGFGEKTEFTSGDIITDFFTASNFIANTYGDKEYLINYDSEFREMLDKTTDFLYTGYIYKGGLVTGEEMRDKMKNKTEGNMVFLGKEGRPILMTPGITTLDELLAHVNKARAEKK